MTIDCRQWVNIEREPQRYRVFVNGVEIHQVWYVDTDAGMVRSFDVLGDKHPHASLAIARNPEWARRAEACGWDLPIDGVASKTVWGIVTLKAIPKEKGDADSSQSTSASGDGQEPRTQHAQPE